jgi:hypothetical protein
LKCWLIGPSGEFVDLNERRLGERLGVDASHEFLIAYCVKNCGHISVRQTSRIVEIRLRHQMTSIIALQSLLSYLDDWQIKIVRLTFVDDGVEDSILDARSLRSRLCALIARDPRLVRQNQGALLSRSISANKSPLSEAGWHFRWKAQECRNFDQVRQLSESIFAGRYTITGFLPQTKDLVIYASGEAYRSFDSNWYSVAKGLRLEDGPDYEYGRWVSKAHKAALLQRAAYFDDVDALIYRPKRGKLRTTYTRMIMPFMLRNGTELVLSASNISNNVNLRELL